MLEIGVTVAICAAALAALHFWWRRRFTRETVLHAGEIAAVRDAAGREIAGLHARQEALLDGMAEGLLILDAGGRIQLANKAFMALFNPACNPRGKTVIEALRLHELQQMADSLVRDTEAASVELKLLDERWMKASAAAIHTATGERSGTVLLFHDLTQIKRLQRMREEFVANVSHELRTPLSLIKGAAETLLDGARQDPQASERFLSMIDRNSERLRLLIEDLLAVSELESGRVKLNLAPIKLRELAEKVAAEFSARARSVDARIINNVPDIQVVGDAGRLEQVLCNLVDNAIKYGKKSGQILMNASLAVDGSAEVEVRDDGPGIPAEALDRIFERFYRVDKARSREQGGTGLGLSIVKHIVQSHGGKVWAESQPGHGSRFRFTLPAPQTGSASPQTDP